MKDRPKKRNPRARKPKSRHEKVECEYCGDRFSKSSLTAHIAVTHQRELTNKELQFNGRA